MGYDIEDNHADRDDHVVVGGYGKLQTDMVPDVSELVAKLDERYYWKNGKTAVFWHLIALLNTHIDSPKE